MPGEERTVATGNKREEAQRKRIKAVIQEDWLRAKLGHGYAFAGKNGYRND